MTNHRILTQTDIERACRPHTDRPITHWRTNPDGTITAFNDLGQKFIITITYLNDLVDPPPPTKHKPASKPKRQ